MKQIGLTLFTLFLIIPIFAQENSSNLQFKFRGFVRGDFFYDSRQHVASSEGLLFLYPKDREEDALGEDLNALASSGFYYLSTRPAVEVTGLKAFDAAVSAYMEGDFAGFGGAYGSSTILRLRLAYMKMDWKKYSLLMGQAWHPFFLTIIPEQLSLSTGAPFQPFARSPQARFDYKMDKFTLSAAGVYQFQFTSNGPNGKSSVYQKNALLPELVAVVDYKNQSITTGLGLNFLTLKPRSQSLIDDKIYKVDENFSSLSYMAYLKYTENLFSLGVKTTYGQNNVNMLMLGGYGVKSIDPKNGKQEYTNFNYSTTWANVSYGKKYKANLFAGYSKNLGSEDSLVENSPLYGEGLAVDNLSRIVSTFSYNIPHFSLGAEYEFSKANYGDTGTFNWKKGTYSSTHAVYSHRIVGVIRYLF